MTTVYLDVCSLNRPFDDQTQARIRLESEAVLMIIVQCDSGRWRWISSDIVELEVSQTPDIERRRRVRTLASGADMNVAAAANEKERALYLVTLGFRAYDALHIACAEGGQADVLITTDDGMIQKAAMHAKQLRVRVCNPLTWLREESAA